MQSVKAFPKEGGQEDIQKINAEIISLSSKEKNYIFGTFIIQFVIFLIIWDYSSRRIKINHNYKIFMIDTFKRKKKSTQN